MKRFWGFLKNKKKLGATTSEYGLIFALIAVLLVATLGNLGTNLSKIFSAVNVALSNSSLSSAEPLNLPEIPEDEDCDDAFSNIISTKVLYESSDFSSLNFTSGSRSCSLSRGADGSITFSHGTYTCDEYSDPLFTFQSGKGYLFEATLTDQSYGSNYVGSITLGGIFAIANIRDSSDYFGDPTGTSWMLGNTRTNRQFTVGNASGTFSAMYSPNGKIAGYIGDASQGCADSSTTMPSAGTDGTLVLSVNNDRMTLSHIKITELSYSPN